MLKLIEALKSVPAEEREQIDQAIEHLEGELDRLKIFQSALRLAGEAETPRLRLTPPDEQGEEILDEAEKILLDETEDEEDRRPTQPPRRRGRRGGKTRLDQVKDYLRKHGVRGAVLDELRNQGSRVMARARKAGEQLSHELEREPRIEELAVALNVKLDDLPERWRQRMVLRCEGGSEGVRDTNHLRGRSRTPAGEGGNLKFEVRWRPRTTSKDSNASSQRSSRRPRVSV